MRIPGTRQPQRGKMHRRQGVERLGRGRKTLELSCQSSYPGVERFGRLHSFPASARTAGHGKAIDDRCFNFWCETEFTEFEVFGASACFRSEPDRDFVCGLGDGFGPNVGPLR